MTVRSPTRWFSTAATTHAQHAPKIKKKVLIIGGGTGGIAVAARITRSLLLRSHPNVSSKFVAVVEPKETHYYQPLWTFVGGGLRQNVQESGKPMHELIPSHADWIKLHVTRIDPQKNAVHLSNGLIVEYDFLVLSPGVVLRYDNTPGLVEALKDDSHPVSTNYSYEYAPKTAALLQKFQGGEAIFTQPSTPVKCAGAPQKIMYIAEELFRTKGIRDKCNITFMQGMPKLFSVDKYAASLFKLCQQRNINVNLNHELLAISPKTQTATFKNLVNGQTFERNYQFMHVTPQMSAPSFIAESGLANEGGYVDVDPFCLRHKKYGNIFALGDAAGLPTSKTAAAIAGQNGVVARNIIKLVEKQYQNSSLDISKVPNSELDCSYDGYTSCSLLVGSKDLILAEFLYDGVPKETFPFDQSKPSRAMFWLNSNVIPYIYWERMMRGVWNGPRNLRKVLNPLNWN